ncbi:MAG: peptide chain release factor N(5)-glutamine methyltransferase [Thermoanaerobaculia bacterium]
MTKERPRSWAGLLAEARGALQDPPYASYEPDELLARATDRPRAWFLSRLREEASVAEAERFRELVARRKSGEPLQYLLGAWEFLGRTFAVDRRALIPRGETEAIVELTRDAAPDARFILDVGTGSGILAVTLALERPAAHVVALDVSPDALTLTRQNARLHGVASRVHPVASDWLGALRTGPVFDLVVSNPPYVPEADAPHLDKTVSAHEPSIALFGGDDGLHPLRILLAQLPRVLKCGARFIFEFGYGQARLVSDAVEGSGSFTLESIRLDPAGIPRTATAIRR